MAIVELKMSDKEFWNCTHKKLQALLKVHYEVQNEKYGSIKEENEVYGDTISL